METRYIVAIEIGSSKIKGIAGAVDPTAAISVIAVEETDSGDSVRHGRVQNAREVATRVNELIRRLENNPQLAHGRITSVFVSEGGRSVMSRPAEASLNLAGEVEITTQILEKLHNEARYNLATDRDVLAISNRRFVVDHSEVKKFVGSFGSSVKGEFTVVTVSPENRRNLERVKIESRGVDIPRTYIPRPIAVAEMVLSDSDRQVGTLLIDIGSETTTIAIYKDKALQLMATLPMGGFNITRDLSIGLGIPDEAAENIKITKGHAVADRIKNPDPDPETAEITNYISARAGEIIANVVSYVDKSGFKIKDLPGGIVITGGGSRLEGLLDMIKTQTKAKVRNAVLDSTISGAPYNTIDNVDVISMVRYATASGAPSCIEFPAQPVAATAAPRPVAASDIQGRRQQVPAENDPELLADDIEQPYNINTEEDLNLGDDMPAPAADAESTRQSLLDRIKNWFTAPDDADLDNENENLEN